MAPKLPHLCHAHPTLDGMFNHVQSGRTCLAAVALFPLVGALRPLLPMSLGLAPGALGSQRSEVQRKEGASKPGSGLQS